jgi:hypothetical protein
VGGTDGGYRVVDKGEGGVPGDWAIALAGLWLACGDPRIGASSPRWDESHEDRIKRAATSPPLLPSQGLGNRVLIAARNLVECPLGTFA